VAATKWEKPVAASPEKSTEKSADKAKPKATKKASPKVMDVSKPGKTTPAATSKPVILGHKMMKDPMVSKSGAEGAEKSAEPSTAPLPRGGKVIKPITITEDGELKQDVAAEEPVPVTKADDAMAAVVKEEPAIETAPVVSQEASAEEPAKEEPAKPSTPPEEPESTTDATSPDATLADKKEKTPGAEDSAVVDAVADQVGAKKKQQTQETEEEKQRRENIEKLIAEKKYFVPTGQVTKKRHTQWAMVALLLLVLIAAAIFAIDAEVVDVGIKLPFDLIKL
jgi:hypothetical protein